MTQYSSVLKDFIDRENNSSLYSYKIGGIMLYPLTRRDLRAIFLRNKGFNQMNLKLKLNRSKAFVTVVLSFFQILKLLLSRKRVKKVIHAFPRVEKVGEYYLDKFTDPVCKLTNITDNAIIFCKSVGGVRKEPRQFSDKVVYEDAIDLCAKIASIIKAKFLTKSEKIVIRDYIEEIRRISDNCVPDEKKLIGDLFSTLYKVKMLTALYNHLEAEKVFVVARPISPVYAAHLAGAKVFEFQHGVTYGLSKLYSGRNDSLYTPDRFLAFGYSQPRNVYGIDEEKIITIGWAFGNYVNEEKPLPYITEKDVLVVSDPEVSDILLEITSSFASQRSDIHFYFRPHPNETMTKVQKERINQFHNLHIQDNTISSNIVLNCFSHIIGENSTVLYEAVSLGKKVGKLFYGGLDTKYLNESDRASFYEISSVTDLNSFLNDRGKATTDLSIYSPWNNEYSYIFD